MLLRVLRTYLSRYRRLLIAIVALQLVSSGAMLYLPTLNADIIDQGITQGDTGYIVRVGFVMLGVAFVQVICAMAAGYFASRSAMSFGRDLRHDLFRTVGRFAPTSSAGSGRPA